MLVLPHPLDADRAAGEGAGDQRRVGAGIVGAVVAVAAGAFGVDAMDLRLVHPQHFGDGGAQREHALGMGPDRHHAVAEQSDRTGRTDRAVDLKAPVEFRLQAMNDAADGGGIVPPVLNHALVGFHRLKIAEQRALVGQRFMLVPFDRMGQHPHGVDRLPFPLRHDGQIVAVAERADDARHPFGNAGVDLADAGAVAGRADDAGMEHSGKPHVVDIGLPAGDLGGDVDARQVATDHAVGGRVLKHRSGQRAGALQLAAGHQLTIAEAPAVRRRDGPLRQLEGIGRHAQALGREIAEDGGDPSGGVQDRRAAFLHRLAARRVALVRRPAGIGRYQGDRGGIDRQFLRRDLEQRGSMPWPSSALPVKTVIRPSASILIQDSSSGLLFSAWHAGRRRPPSGLLRGLGQQASGEKREAYDESAAAEEAPARQDGSVHRRSSPLVAAAARHRRSA